MIWSYFEKKYKNNVRFCEVRDHFPKPLHRDARSPHSRSADRVRVDARAPHFNKSTAPLTFRSQFPQWPADEAGRHRIRRDDQTPSNHVRQPGTRPIGPLGQRRQRHTEQSQRPRSATRPQPEQGKHTTHPPDTSTVIPVDSDFPPVRRAAFPRAHTPNWRKCRKIGGRWRH